MAVLEKEALKKKLIEHFENVDDENSIEMIEDISDTLDNIGDGSEWETKYKDLKKKYIERFKKKEETEETEEEETEEEEIEEEEKEVTEDDIFEVKEEK